MENSAPEKLSERLRYMPLDLSPSANSSSAPRPNLSRLGLSVDFQILGSGLKAHAPHAAEAHAIGLEPQRKQLQRAQAHPEQARVLS